LEKKIDALAISVRQYERIIERGIESLFKNLTVEKAKKYLNLNKKKHLQVSRFILILDPGFQMLYEICRRK